MIFGGGFDPTSIQRFGADNSEVLAKLAQMDAAERKHTGIIVAESGKQAGAQRKLSEQMSLLTSAVGGQTSALGKLAFGAKVLVGGFGGVGIAMLGVGTAMRALAPVTDKLIAGFVDLVGLGEKPRWTPLLDNLAAVNTILSESAANAKLVAARLSAMSGGARREAELATLDRKIRLLESQLGAAFQARSVARGLQRFGAIADVSRLEAEIEIAKIEQFNLSRSAEEIEREGKKTAATRTQTKALEEQLGVLEELTRLQQQGWLAKNWGGPKPTTDADLLGIIEKEGDIKGGDSAQLKELLKPDKMAKMVEQISLGTQALDAFRDAATSAFAVLVDGSQSLGESLRTFFGEFFKGMAMKLYAYALEAAIQLNFAKAALAFGGAAIVTGFARQFGASGTPGGSGGVGGFSGGGGGSQTTTTTIFVGDSFAGDSNRIKRAKIRRLIGEGSGDYES